MQRSISCNRCVPNERFDDTSLEERQRVVVKLGHRVHDLIERTEGHVKIIPPEALVTELFDAVQNEEEAGHAVIQYLSGWSGRLLQDTPDHRAALWIRLKAMADGVFELQPREFALNAKELARLVSGPEEPVDNRIALWRLLARTHERVEGEPALFEAQAELAHGVGEWREEERACYSLIDLLRRLRKPGETRSRLVWANVRLLALYAPGKPLDDRDRFSDCQLQMARLSETGLRAREAYRPTVGSWMWDQVAEEIARLSGESHDAPSIVAGLLTAWVEATEAAQIPGRTAQMIHGLGRLRERQRRVIVARLAESVHQWLERRPDDIAALWVRLRVMVAGLIDPQAEEFVARAARLAEMVIPDLYPDVVSLLAEAPDAVRNSSACLSLRANLYHDLGRFGDEEHAWWSFIGLFARDSKGNGAEMISAYRRLRDLYAPTGPLGNPDRHRECKLHLARRSADVESAVTAYGPLLRGWTWERIAGEITACIAERAPAAAAGLLWVFLTSGEPTFIPERADKAVAHLSDPRHAPDRLLRDQLTSWTTRLLQDTPDPQAALWLRLAAMANGFFDIRGPEFVENASRLARLMDSDHQLDSLLQILLRAPAIVRQLPGYYRLAASLYRRRDRWKEEAEALGNLIKTLGKSGRTASASLVPIYKRLSDLHAAEGPVADQERHLDCLLQLARLSENTGEAVSAYEPLVPGWTWEELAAEVAACHAEIAQAAPVVAGLVFSWVATGGHESLPARAARVATILSLQQQTKGDATSRHMIGWITQMLRDMPGSQVALWIKLNCAVAGIFPITPKELIHDAQHLESLAADDEALELALLLERSLESVRGSVQYLVLRANLLHRLQQFADEAEVWQKVLTIYAGIAEANGQVVVIACKRLCELFAPEGPLPNPVQYRKCCLLLGRLATSAVAAAQAYQITVNGWSWEQVQEELAVIAAECPQPSSIAAGLLCAWAAAADETSTGQRIVLIARCLANDRRRLVRQFTDAEAMLFVSHVGVDQLAAQPAVAAFFAELLLSTTGANAQRRHTGLRLALAALSAQEQLRSTEVLTGHLLDAVSNGEQLPEGGATNLNRVLFADAQKVDILKRLLESARYNRAAHRRIIDTLAPEFHPTSLPELKRWFDVFPPAVLQASPERALHVLRAATDVVVALSKGTSVDPDTVRAIHDLVYRFLDDDRYGPEFHSLWLKIIRRFKKRVGPYIQRCLGGGPAHWKWAEEALDCLLAEGDPTFVLPEGVQPCLRPFLDSLRSPRGGLPDRIERARQFYHLIHGQLSWEEWERWTRTADEGTLPVLRGLFNPENGVARANMLLAVVSVLRDSLQSRGLAPVWLDALEVETLWQAGRFAEAVHLAKQLPGHRFGPEKLTAEELEKQGHQSNDGTEPEVPDHDYQRILRACFLGRNFAAR